MRVILIAFSLLLLSAGAFAHGDKVHVRGTITGVNDTSVTVKSSDGKIVEVKLVKTTTYTLRADNADQPAKASDLAVGQMVVIHATPVGTVLQADEIKFSAAANGAPQKPATPKSAS